MSGAWSRRALLVGIGAGLLLPRVARADRPVILVLTSGASPRAETITTVFREQTSGATRVSYELGPEVDAAAFLADGTRDLTVSLVVALGDRAFAAAAREFAAVPLIYADVSDTSSVAGRDNVVGLSLRPDPARGLERVKAVLPRVGVVGVIRSARDNDAAWYAALDAGATALGLRVVTETVTSASDVNNALAGLISRADLVWPQPDPRLWTGAVASRALQECLLAKKPILGLDRSWLAASAGAPLVLESSAAGIGSAAASAARRVLGLESTAAAAAFPEPWLVGSRDAWRTLGLILKKETAALIDEWAS